MSKEPSLVSTHIDVGSFESNRLGGLRCVARQEPEELDVIAIPFNGVECLAFQVEATHEEGRRTVLDGGGHDELVDAQRVESRTCN